MSLKTNKKFAGIYKIINVKNNKFYIGSTINFYKRFRIHRWELVNNKHKNRHLQNSFNKHGEENFKIEVLAICPKEYLLKLEQWFIDVLKPQYNLTPTAGSNRGYTQTKEERLKRKISVTKTYAEKYSKDRDAILTLLNEGKSQSEIANLIGYKYPNRISKFLKRKGISYDNNLLLKRHKDKEKLRDIEIEKYVKEGLSIKQMVVKLKSAKSTISRSIKRLGLWEERHIYKNKSN